VQVTLSVKLPLCKYEFKPGSRVLLSCSLSVCLSIYVVHVCMCSKRDSSFWCAGVYRQGSPLSNVSGRSVSCKMLQWCRKVWQDSQPLHPFWYPCYISRSLALVGRPICIRCMVMHPGICRCWQLPAALYWTMTSGCVSGLRVSLPLQHAAACWCAHLCPSSSREYGLGFGRILLPGIGNA